MAEDLRPTLLPAFISEWMFSTAIAAPTTSGQVRLNSNNQRNITLLWIDKVTANGNDASPYLAILKSGSEVRLTDITDSAKWQSYTLTGATVDKGTYVECPALWKAGGTNLTANRLVVDLPLVSVSTAVTGFSLATAISSVGVTGQLVTRDFAFPFDGKVYTSPGMTLRQYYAGQAVIAFCSLPNTTASNLMGGALAEFAFKVADSMIAFEAREALGYHRPPVGTDPNASQQVAQQQDIQKLTRLAGQRRWQG